MQPESAAVASSTPPAKRGLSSFMIGPSSGDARHRRMLNSTCPDKDKAAPRERNGLGLTRVSKGLFFVLIAAGVAQMILHRLATAFVTVAGVRLGVRRGVGM